MNKKGLSGWAWFWIVLISIFFFTSFFLGPSVYEGYDSYDSYDYDLEEDPYDYCYDIYYDVLCGCDANYYNCDNFPTQEDAQECYDLCNCLGKGDLHELDRDNDGLACEWNN